MNAGIAMRLAAILALLLAAGCARSLVIDLLDGATEKLVWQALAEATLSSDPRKNAEKAGSVVAKAFAKFPPASSP